MIYYVFSFELSFNVSVDDLIYFFIPVLIIKLQKLILFLFSENVF